MTNFKQWVLLIALGLIIYGNAYSQVIENNETWIKVAEGFNFPEGPAYDGKSSIFLSNCYGGWIAKYSKSFVDTVVSNISNPSTIEKTNGLTFGKDGLLYVCEYGKGKILRINKDAGIDILANGYKGDKFNRPNDLTIDVNGNLFFTDPKSYDSNILDGRIFFIDIKTKAIKMLSDSLAFPNGINISPLDGKLYVCESAKHKVIRFEITSENNLINKTDFAYIPDGDPDGIEFDIKGNLYVAHYGGKAVYIYSPDGKELQKIETPGAKPTNLEFGDEDLKSLYLTEVETNALYKIRTNTAGKQIK